MRPVRRISAQTLSVNPFTKTLMNASDRQAVSHTPHRVTLRSSARPLWPTRLLHSSLPPPLSVFILQTLWSAGSKTAGIKKYTVEAKRKFFVCTTYRRNGDEESS